MLDKNEYTLYKPLIPPVFISRRDGRTCKKVKCTV